MAQGRWVESVHQGQVVVHHSGFLQRTVDLMSETFLNNTDSNILTWLYQSFILVHVHPSVQVLSP